MEEKQRIRAQRLKVLEKQALGKTAGQTRIKSSPPKSNLSSPPKSNLSSPPKSNLPKPIQPSTWSCFKCTYINTKSQCEMCGCIES